MLLLPEPRFRTMSIGVGVGWGGACWGWVGDTGVEWAVKNSLNNLICHKLGVLSFLLKNYCQLLSG